MPRRGKDDECFRLRLQCASSLPVPRDIVPQHCPGGLVARSSCTYLTALIQFAALLRQDAVLFEFLVPHIVPVAMASIDPRIRPRVLAYTMHLAMPVSHDLSGIRHLSPGADRAIPTIGLGGSGLSPRRQQSELASPTRFLYVGQSPRDRVGLGAVMARCLTGGELFTRRPSQRHHAHQPIPQHITAHPVTNGAGGGRRITLEMRWSRKRQRRGHYCKGAVRYVLNGGTLGPGHGAGLSIPAHSLGWLDAAYCDGRRLRWRPELRRWSS